MAIAFFVLILTLIPPSSADGSSSSSSFNVRHHLSTVTRCDAGKEANNAVYSPYIIQDGCTPIHLNLLGCGYKDFCPFEVFKEKVASPHLKHEFETLCKPKLEQKPCSIFCKLLEWFKKICLQKDSSKHSGSQKTEL